MIAHLRNTSLVMLGLAGPVLAGDNVRLVDRPADRTDVRRLDIKPTDKAQDDVERTHFRFGMRFYGGYGYYGGFGYGYQPYSYFGYRPYSYFGYRPYSYFGYWPYSYSYFAPSLSFYAPRYYSYPVYSYWYDLPPVYYSVPSYYYSPIVIYSPIASASPSTDERRNGTTTFRYDGDRPTTPPVERIPPAKIDVPTVPELPKPPAVPNLGPSPTERMVSAPLPTVKKKYSYPAYGEDREPARDDKSLLIRRDK